MSQSDFTSTLKSYLDEKRDYHHEWKNKNLYITPLTILSWIIPGFLNIPFYWNLFRFYSHWSAELAAKSVLANLNNTKQPHSSLVPINISFKSNDDLDDIVKSLLRGDSKHISEDNIEDIAEEFSIDDSGEKEIMRSARYIIHPPTWEITSKDFNKYWNNIKNRKHNKK